MAFETMVSARSLLNSLIPRWRAVCPGISVGNAQLLLIFLKVNAQNFRIMPQSKMSS